LLHGSTAAQQQQTLPTQRGNEPTLSTRGDHEDAEVKKEIQRYRGDNEGAPRKNRTSTQKSAPSKSTESASLNVCREILTSSALAHQLAQDNKKSLATFHHRCHQLCGRKSVQTSHYQTSNKTRRTNTQAKHSKGELAKEHKKTSANKAKKSKNQKKQKGKSSKRAKQAKQQNKP
jgi:hypothetical protein